jgi:import inner membrane translocase subunit TIM17
VDDLGQGFGLGLILGSMWNFMKGVYISPAKERIRGGILLAKRRAPITGGNFASWMGLFGFWQCSLLYATGQDSHANQILAGALTGGMVNLRGGWKYAQRGFFSGALFIGVFNMIEVLVTKKMLRQEVLRKQIETRY